MFVGEARDLGDILTVARAVRQRRAADEGSPVVDRLGEPLRGNRAVRIRPHMNDLSAA